MYDIGQHDPSTASTPSTSSGQASSGQAAAPYIVSELLEGETLRERLSAGALTIRKVEDYAVRIDIGGIGTLSQYDVHHDGQRFVILAPATDTPQPLNVILNWQSFVSK